MAIQTAVISKIESGEIKIVRQVFDELERRFTDIYDRLKDYKSVGQVADEIADCADVIAEVRAIQHNHPRLYRQFGNSNSADPLIVAVAKQMQALVVTDERSQGPGHQRRIPWVCTQRNVGWTDGVDFINRIMGKD